MQKQRIYNLCDDVLRHDTARGLFKLETGYTEPPTVVSARVVYKTADLYTAAAYMGAGWLAGAGVVWDTKRVWFICKGETHDLWRAAGIRKLGATGARAVMDQLDFVSDPVSPAVRQYREDRIDVNTVRHLIALHWPALRVRRPSRPGEPEVLFEPRVGSSLFLGGVVWDRERYLSGWVFDCIGVDRRRFLRL